MKTLIATLIAAAALVGTQASADSVKVYTLSEMVSPRINVDPDEGALNVVVHVDATRELSSITVPACASLTLDFQGDYVLTSKTFIEPPHEGTTNIWTSARDVEALWKERFSVEGGGSTTLCTAGQLVLGSLGPLVFFGAKAGSTVFLDGTEVVYKGAVDGLELLKQNEVGIVWGGKDIKLVGKIGAEPGPTPPVPEPATGSLSLLALAGLCARRRRK